MTSESRGGERRGRVVCGCSNRRACRMSETQKENQDEWRAREEALAAPAKHERLKLCAQ